jgi:hypothetical protein
MDSLRPLEASQQKSKDRKRVLGRGALVFASGWISNATWAGAMAFNRVAEHNDTSTLVPSLLFLAGTTAAEYGMTYLATDGDIDMTWEPKRKFTTFVKKVSQKLPLATTAWRGAASGVYLDSLNGRNVSRGRRLAHALLYGGIVGAWASEPGNKAFQALGNAAEYLSENLAVSAGLGATVVGAAIYGYRSTEVESAVTHIQQSPIPEQE